MLPGLRPVSGSSEEAPTGLRSTRVARREADGVDHVAVQELEGTHGGFELAVQPPGRKADHGETHRDFDEHRSSGRHRR
jgi:hypothetical protein